MSRKVIGFPNNGGGNGGGSTPLVFSDGPQTYTWTSDDDGTAASWYGSSARMKILKDWVPLVTGTLTLPAVDTSADGNSGDFDFYVWHGNRADVDYPSQGDGSADFTNNSNGVDVMDNSSASLSVVAGDHYTIIAVNWSGAATSHPTIDLDPFYAALAPFGGITPESPPDYTLSGKTWVVVPLPDGTLAIKPLDVAGGPPSVALGDLTDASIATPAQGQLIQYNDSDSKWENPGMNSLVAGQILIWNGSQFINSGLHISIDGGEGGEQVISSNDGTNNAALDLHPGQVARLQYNSSGLAVFDEFVAVENVPLSLEGNVPGLTAGDMAGSPVILSPNSTAYRLKVANDGTLSTEAV